MIFLRLHGGIGNQLFQIGAALLVAEKRGDSNIYIAERALQRYAAKRRNCLPDLLDFRKIPFSCVFRESCVLELRLAKLLPFSSPLVSFYSDHNLDLSKKVSGRAIYLDGYFQKGLQQEYFDRQVSILRSSFGLSIPYEAESAIIHIRGCDFRELGWGLEASKEFYLDAVSFLARERGVYRFKVVTDDAGYAKSLLGSGYAFEYVSGDEVEHFRMIVGARYRILSASTFAFWASAIGGSEDSIVIAPKRWANGNFRMIRLPGEVDLTS